MTTKTQIKPKTQTKKPALPAKSKKALATNRAAPRPNRKSPQPKLATTKPKTKLAIIRDLIERSKGATIVELTNATRWQAHSVRAAITGLRKGGTDVVRTKDDDGVTRYCIKAPVK